MKKHLSFILLLTMFVSGCVKNDLEEKRLQPVSGRVFTASFESENARTYVEEGNLLRWNAGDQIALFDSNTLNRQYQFDGETGDNAGTFSIVNAPFGTGNDLNCHYALYPYASNVKITENGVITATLPSVQSYAENSFGLGANTMVAVTKDVDDTFLKFRNVGGYLKLQLYGDNVTVKSITLTGNNNEKLAGKATITPAYGQSPTLAMSDDATTSITLDCGDGVKIGTTAETATAFWIVVPPTIFEEGLTITVTEIDGESFNKSTSNAVVVERNTIKPMAVFEVEIEKIPNNQIWYTSTNGNIVNPSRSAAFSVNIESNVYINGKGIITFDGDVTTIGHSAFAGCSNLTSVTLPNSVTSSIGQGAFGSCWDLISVTLSDSVTSIEMNAFSSCTSLKSVTIPNSVTSIGSSAFSNCSSLTSVTIGNGVTTISDNAFFYCSALTEIKVEQGNPVYDSRDNCNAIIETETNKLIKGCDTTIIPNGVTEIGTQAFCRCINLREIIIPNGVTKIADVAFLDCPALTSISIPSSVTNMPSYGPPCHACPSLATIVVEQSNPIYDSRENCNAIIETKTNKLIQGSNTTIVPNSVTEIGRYSFMGRAMSEITIPSSVTTIGESAFIGCGQLTKVNVLATTPPTIYSDTFSNCGSDMKVYVPAGSLAAYKAAEYWKDLNIMTDTIPNNQIWYTSTDGQIVEPYKDEGFGAYIVSNTYENGKGIITFDGDVTMIGKSAFDSRYNLKSIIIPDGVVLIDSYAFHDCNSLTNVTIPDSVIMINYWGFAWCTSLTNFIIPNSVSTIGEGAFYNCESLQSVTIGENVTWIGKQAFENCSSLISVTIPNSVTTIGESAFGFCDNLKEFKGKFASEDARCLIVDGVLNSFAPAGLTEYTIPGSVTTIGDCAFLCCSNLTSVTIPNSVTTIGEMAFASLSPDNSNLKTIIIPDSVTTIGAWAFLLCDNLTSVTIGKNVTTIGDEAFSDCYRLSIVYCKATTPPTALDIDMNNKWDAFFANASGRKIFVPRGSVDPYKWAKGWSNYASDIVGYDF